MLTGHACRGQPELLAPALPHRAGPCPDAMAPASQHLLLGGFGIALDRTPSGTAALPGSTQAPADVSHCFQKTSELPTSGLRTDTQPKKDFMNSVPSAPWGGQHVGVEGR